MMWRRQLGLERKLGGADFIFVIIVALTYLALQIEPSAAASMCTSLLVYPCRRQRLHSPDCIV